MNFLIGLLRAQRTMEVRLLAALNAYMRAQTFPRLIQTSTLGASDRTVNSGRHAPSSSSHDGRLGPARGVQIEMREKTFRWRLGRTFPREAVELLERQGLGRGARVQLGTQWGQFALCL